MGNALKIPAPSNWLNLTKLTWTVCVFPGPVLQPDDQHHSEWHHQHAAVPQHGEVLEGPTRHLCDAQTGGGALEERPVQEAPHHRLVRLNHTWVTSFHFLQPSTPVHKPQTIDLKLQNIYFKKAFSSISTSWRISSQFFLRIPVQSFVKTLQIH